MLKMYHSQSSHTGSSVDFWEENWAVSEFEESIRFMAVDPLRRLFEKYLRPDSLMLEGGCGMGNYISYYSARGINVIGLDFAQKALRTLRIRQPALKLIAGDVSKMPFPDETFDLYYSGGVVEHFEGGAEESLREARRVLKSNGTLLISVPYFNPLRRLLAAFRRDDWQTLDHAERDQNLPEGKAFFQYAYKKAEFISMLSAAGLETIDTQGYAVLWGIQELPIFRFGSRREFSAGNSNAVDSPPSYVDVSKIAGDRKTSLVKRLVVSEDDTVPVLGLGVRLMRWSVANMMMYVCRHN
ncbi:MAG TPA: methyltransferase domain-containing protein [Pyrinomonadaceae bacterium]|nr:hypothetical protein [Blastocatellia bacterium]HRJ88837.1 methyltransferase domain-containing protein [Pyrinomonadaceae bacterium]HRK48890.1 methyltransferase domain-containing protein [Pyrinomonadaceae bacterium]